MPSGQSHGGGAQSSSHGTVAVHRRGHGPDERSVFAEEGRRPAARIPSQPPPELRWPHAASLCAPPAASKGAPRGGRFIYIPTVPGTASSPCRSTPGRPPPPTSPREAVSLVPQIPPRVRVG
eukprot:scaffold14000_cov135-Isochrysis_galbana.AAC.2